MANSPLDHIDPTLRESRFTAGSVLKADVAGAPTWNKGDLPTIRVWVKAS